MEEIGFAQVVASLDAMLEARGQRDYDVELLVENIHQLYKGKIAAGRRFSAREMAGWQGKLHSFAILAQAAEQVLLAIYPARVARGEVVSAEEIEELQEILVDAASGDPEREIAVRNLGTVYQARIAKGQSVAADEMECLIDLLGELDCYSAATEVLAAIYQIKIAKGEAVKAETMNRLKEMLAGIDSYACEGAFRVLCAIYQAKINRGESVSTAETEDLLVTLFRRTDQYNVLPVGALGAIYQAKIDKGQAVSASEMRKLHGVVGWEQSRIYDPSGVARRAAIILLGVIFQAKIARGESVDAEDLKGLRDKFGEMNSYEHADRDTEHFRHDVSECAIRVLVAIYRAKIDKGEGVSAEDINDLRRKLADRYPDVRSDACLVLWCMYQARMSNGETVSAGEMEELEPMLSDRYLRIRERATEVLGAACRARTARGETVNKEDASGAVTVILSPPSRARMSRSDAVEFRTEYLRLSQGTGQEKKQGLLLLKRQMPSLLEYWFPTKDADANDMN